MSDDLNKAITTYITAFNAAAEGEALFVNRNKYMQYLAEYQQDNPIAGPLHPSYQNMLGHIAQKYGNSMSFQSLGIRTMRDDAGNFIQKTIVAEFKLGGDDRTVLLTTADRTKIAMMGVAGTLASTTVRHLNAEMAKVKQAISEKEQTLIELGVLPKPTPKP